MGLKSSILLLFVCVIASYRTAEAQDTPEMYYYPPIYYKETPFGYEMLTKLPRDTIVIRDTVYISDMDDFLQRHLGHRSDIDEMAGKIAAIQQAIDSLGGLSDQAVFYNFFRKSDSLHMIADNFIVKEFNIGTDLKTVLLRNNDVDINDTVSLSREILFRCDGAELTDRFIQDKDAIVQCLSYLFTQMQKDSTVIEGINLYFPDYDFRHIRAMTQFVKSVRILMDASRDFKYGTAKLTVIFHSHETLSVNMEHAVRYCLKQEASDVIFIDRTDVDHNFYVKGERTANDMDNAGLLKKIISHLYIARYYTGDTDIRSGTMTNFSENSVKEIIWMDYPENNWEIYMSMIILISVVLVILVILYNIYVPFSTLVASSTESVLLIVIVVALEIGILLLTVFQNMCKEDSFTMIERHPLIIFLLPIIVILIAPLLHKIIKNKKLP